MDFLIINKILIILTNLIGIWLVFWVYFADKKKDLNRSFVLLVIPNLLWIDFYNLAFWINDYHISLLFTRLLYSSVSIFFIGFYYFFIIWFLGEKKRFIFLGRIIIVYEIIFSFISVFTNLVIKDIGFGKWGIIPIYSPIGGFIYHAIIVFLTLFIGGRLIIRYFEFSKEAQTKIKFFLIGVIIFSIGNLIFGVILPFFFYERDYLNIANYSTIIFLTLTAYAIVKQELMGIKTLLTQVLIVVISMVLLVDVLFLSVNLTMQLLKLGILLTFLYFSRELVKSVRKEKEARVEMEKINKNLEEKNEDLESLLSLSQTSAYGEEIEKNIQEIMDSIPIKLGHLKNMGAVLTRYDKKSGKISAYITTESPIIQSAKKLLSKPILTDYYILVDKKDSIEKLNLTAQCIVKNEIKMGESLADFVCPPVEKPIALAMQKMMGVKSNVAVPISIRKETLGALIFMFSKPLAEIGDRDINLLQAFTQQIGIVLENFNFYQRLEKNIDELAKANDELKELIEMKNSFLHIVSHQLRTPLTAMRGYISMWQEGDFDDYPPRKLAEVKTRIANNTERLNNLVNEMVAAMESEGGIKLDFKKVDIEEIIKSNIEILKSNYEAKKLYLRYRKTEKNLPKIDADAKYLANAFMNLIDNAEKYTAKGGLKIKISREKDNVKIAFIDTGAGINSEDGKKLFQKFSRGAASSLINPNGSGLGLFIVKQIIRDHHGKIEFASGGEGKGTTFTVTLPVRQLVSTTTGGAVVPSAGGEVAKAG